MAQDRAKQLLQQGITAAKAGQKDEARQILQQAVRLAPQNETIWLWLSSVARDNKERIFCLKQLLDVNPKNEHAIKGLQALGVTATEAKDSTAPSVPQLTQGKLNKIQANIDEFLREYSPEPHTVLNVEWVQKSKNRYLENSARKLKRTRNIIYSSMAAVTMLLCIFLTITLDIPGQLAADTPTLVVFDTLQASVTSTVTITPTIGSTSTPSPTPLATATDIPLAGNNLQAGNIFPTATDIYPDFDSNVRLSMSTAVYSFDREDYAAVHDISSDRRENQGTNCFPSIYYYDALAMAKEGEYDEANALLQEGLQNPRCQGVTDKEAFLYLGMCIVRFEESTVGRKPEDYDVDSLLRTGQADFLANGALELCGAASDGDFGLFEALDYTAKIDLAVAEWALANEDFAEFIFRLNLAADLIDERALGLEGAGSVGRFRTNIALLLTRADVELIRGEPHDALTYVHTALYLIPTDQDSLRKQVETFAMIADQQVDDEDTLVDERLLRYGEMAGHAETYVNYYPGKAIGYVLLARARYAEGSPDRALSAVNRVIAAEEDLPVIEKEGIIGAHTLRAQIYMDQQDWQKALADLQRLAELEPNNTDWAVQKTIVALELGDFDIVQENIATGLAADPENPLFLLAQTRLDSVTCQYVSSLRCDAEAVLETLTPEFVETLTPAQQTEALYYQTEAELAILLDDDELTATQRTAQLNTLTTQAVTLLTGNPTAEGYYLLGRIYEATEQPALAARTYEWITYWGQSYEYPFSDDLDDRIEAVTDLLAELAEEAE